jgi:hypothetical protein
MRRIGMRACVIIAAAVAAGCNRQDADALSKIGQLLVQRAKALPISPTQSKLVKPLPTTEDPGRGEDQGK